MPLLRNTKHEKFCRLVAAGEPKTKAYREAGYRPSNSAPYALCREPEIKARIAELKNELLPSVRDDSLLDPGRPPVFSKEQVLFEAGIMAFSDMGDFMVLDVQEPFLDLRRVHPIKARAIVGLDVTTVTFRYANGTERITRTMKIKLANKLDALDMIARLQGYYPQRGDDVSKSDPFARMSTDELRQWIADQLARSPVSRTLGGGEVQERDEEEGDGEAREC